MPKNTNYSKSVIYCIRCKNENIIDEYVGASVHHTSRKSNHKLNCLNPNRKDYNQPVYKFIRDNGGWDNWTFIILEKYPCNDIIELRIRERYWIELRKSTLNKLTPSRTREEWYKKNFIDDRGEMYENKKKQKIEYRNANREYLNERAREKIECECGAIFCRDNFSKHLKTEKHLIFINSKPNI